MVSSLNLECCFAQKGNVAKNDESSRFWLHGFWTHSSSDQAVEREDMFNGCRTFVSSEKLWFV